MLLALAVGMLVLAELAAAVDLAVSPLGKLLHGGSALAVAVPKCALVAHFLFLLLGLGPRRHDAFAVVGAGAVIAALLYWGLPAGAERGQLWFAATVVGGGGGLASLAVLVQRARREFAARRLLLASVFIVLFGLYGGALLDVTAALHPATFDGAAYRIDHALGFDPSVLLARVTATTPVLAAVLSVAYVGLPYACSWLFALQLRQAHQPPVDFFLVWAATTVAAMVIGYQLCPVSGPRYAFPDTAFPLHMSDFLPPSFASAVIAPAPRNGMPSMHFGWALLLLINAWWLADGVLARWARRAAL